MSLENIPEILESHKNYQKGETIKLEPYTLSRYICPVCHIRYGEPAKDGFMDVERCEKHQKKGDLN